MFFYFYSKSPAIIKINGVYHGKIDGGFNKMFLDISSPPFVEVCFFCSKTSPLFFMLDNNFLCSPPDNVIIVNLKGGYAITINEQRATLPFSIINQQKYPFAVATVFNDNGLKLSIETANDFFAKNLDFCCDNAEILPFCLDNKQFLAVNFLGEHNLLTCFLIENKITEIFSKSVIEFSLENGFTTTEKFLTIAKHKLTCSWSLNGEKFSPLNKHVEKDADYNLDNIVDCVLPYAFLEEFIIGEVVDEFLCDSVKENAKFLNDYFGDYIGVFPPPSFRKEDEIALLYKNGYNKYKVEYFTFELNNRKICNIKRSDN